MTLFLIYYMYANYGCRDGPVAAALACALCAPQGEQPLRAEESGEQVPHEGPFADESAGKAYLIYL